MSETVIGLFPQDQQAQAIVPWLLSHGFQQNDIDLICGGDAARARGAEGSDLIDKLSRLGVADAQLRQCYVDGIGSGGTLLAARAADEAKAEEAARIMRERGASNCASSTAAQGEGVARLPVIEEELRVGKRQVETGGVRVRQEVSERPVEAEVTLREEHVNVERRPVDRPLTEADRDAAFKDQTIEMTERGEQAVVQKAGKVVEEVVVNKDVDQRTEKVRDTVRRTDVKVEKIEGDDQPKPN
ncbi:MAG TPA: YsnF/AvaK domain-containing protein [Tepidisphaeraceae bacterium]|nr:YsnF/AvaK domain-containing protein [Tepidisphaeraceae bacterium]